MEGRALLWFARAVPTLKLRALRTTDVARQAGCSAQLVRNLEHDGVLPAVPRTGSGYRQYTDQHTRLVRAYLALSVGLGPTEAKQLLRAVPTARLEDTLAALDRAHGRLDQERSQLRAARHAAQLIARETVEAAETDAMSISELADALGVRPSTLRHWEAESLVAPDRVTTRRIRRYTPAHVRDARIVSQLRLAGQRIDTLKSLMPALRAGHPQQSLDQGLRARQAAITRRSRALLEAAAHLYPTLFCRQ